MYTSVKHDLKKTLDDIQSAGLYSVNDCLTHHSHRMFSAAKKTSSTFAQTTTWV
jgi:hypothetical protein